MKWLPYLTPLIVPALGAQQNTANPASDSVAKEATLGAQLAGNFERENQLLDNAQVNGYLKSVGERLLKQIPDTGFTFHFAAFVDSEKSATHEPKVLPGAYIYVPESLILAASDEAEFAGMLAHAIAHAANRDATRQASRGMASRLLAAPKGGGTLESLAQQQMETASALSFAVPEGL
jgi:predicted Zn-dependent protease